MERERWRGKEAGASGKMYVAIEERGTTGGWKEIGGIDDDDVVRED